MKQIEVQILQQSYLLACPDGQESRLLDAVERVDTAMTRIRDAGKVRARERIAVLAALNLAFEVADRDAAAAQAAAQPAPAAAPTSAVAPTEEETLRLQSLLSRLDQALGQDGQLL
ncbi:cell division protein ZapA [Acidovorax temperans]|jgi:cell division protein ZapA|uniref:cell division protein ZapA n=1 Tax=Acidovorax temperans TaxID=80878 RepID=UPI000836C5A5|nr:cell division protein ZapA [Acidovorax temperans]MBP6579078.1 cell division protein ZapA [Acidovorax sp.]TXH95375.1 MAG: cell division protein ZapA [Pseudomonas sp.]MBP8147259.1 cell division protein ZapA [Acidovorax sp.]HRL52780.1 cell division protein ZapA [Acidovorax temperans]HRM63563.1 cell division protein ZapA [Acidovorax temperans]